MARVLFSDIALYAGEDLRTGLEKDDLLDRLRPEIERARVFYHHQVDPGMVERDRFFDWALVDVLLYANRRISTHIW